MSDTMNNDPTPKRAVEPKSEETVEHAATMGAEPTNADNELHDVATATKQPTKRMGRMRVYVRRFFRNYMAVVGLILVAFLVLVAIVVPPFCHARWGWDYKSVDYLNLSVGPMETHWFGTTDTGGDLLAQIGHGLRRSLIIALAVSAMTTIIAAVIGASAAYLGGIWEKMILWIIHFLMVVPTFLILALVANKVGGHWLWLIFALTVLGWMSSARVIWSLSMSVREREFVTAARYMGVNGFISVVRHIVPNIGSLLVLQFAFGIVGAVNAETGLAFLGFGVKPPDVSLGALLGEGSNNITSMPWLFYFPAGALTMLTFGMAFIADGLRDALDPNSAAGGKA